MSTGFFKYFVRSYLIKFEYRAFSEYSPKSLFKEILLLILSLISITSRTTSLIPRQLLIRGASSKRYFVARFSQTWLLEAEQKKISESIIY